MIVLFPESIKNGAGGTMEEPSPDYFSYLLRFWRTGPDRPWRASLEDPRTGERWGFGSLEALQEFLRRRMSQPLHSNQNESQSKGG